MSDLFGQQSIYLPAQCSKCFWTITAWPDDDSDDPNDKVVFQYCSHPQHTARAFSPCGERRDLLPHEMPVRPRRTTPNIFIECVVLRDSEKAWLVFSFVVKRQFWLSKSQTKVTPPKKGEGISVIELPVWLAKKNGLS